MYPILSKEWRIIWLLPIIIALALIFARAPDALHAQNGTLPPPLFSKTDHGASVAAGGSITYDLSYSNPNPSPLANVVISETVPSGTSFTAGDNPGWTCSGAGVCTYAVGAVAAGGADVVKFVVRVNNPVPAGLEEVANTAAIGTTTSGVLATSSDTTPVNAAPDLFVSKTDNQKTTVPGAVLHYAITYGNRGSQNASNVILMESVPIGAKFKAGASSAGWSCIPSSGAAGSLCSFTVPEVIANGLNNQTTFAVTVLNPAATGVNRIKNTVTINDDLASGADANLTDNSDLDSTTLNAAPDLDVSVQDTPDPVTPGALLTYNITYRNTGNQNASNLHLYTQLPANTTFVAASSSPEWVFDAALNQNKLARGSLFAGKSAVAIFVVKVNNAIPAGVTGLQNTVRISDDGRNGPDPTPANNTLTASTALNAAPDLAITKSDDDVVAEPGDIVLYHLAYANLGTRGATGVTLVETAPAHTTFVAAASTSGWVCTPNNNAASVCKLNLNPLAAQAGGNAAFAIQVDAPLAAAVLQIENTASISDDGANGVDADLLNNQDSESTPVEVSAALNLTKSDDGVTVPPGETIQYTLNYANLDTLDVIGVVLTETVPANTTFVGPAADWSCVVGAPAGATCTHTVGNLAAGQSGAQTFVVRINNTLPDETFAITNLASIGSSIAPNTDTGSETTPIGGAPDLQISKSDGGVTATPGQGLLYQLHYANQGTRVATLVRITETVPANTSFDSTASSVGWSCLGGGVANSLCSYPLSRLASDGIVSSIDFAVLVNPTLPAGVASITNTVTISDDGRHNPDADQDNNRATLATIVAAAPDLALQKDDGGITSEPGKTVVYTLSYANLGTEGATDVTLTETTPAHTRFNADLSTEGWACTPDEEAGSICTLTFDSLPAGANGSVAFAVMIDRPIPDGVTQIENTATIADNGASGADSNPANNTANDTTPISAPPLDITKDDGGITIDRGEVIEYLLQFSNNGATPLTGVVITETVPANTVFGGPAAKWSCPVGSPAGTICSHEVGKLKAAQSRDLPFRVQVNAEAPAEVASIENEAYIGSDLLPNADLASESTPLKTPAHLTLSKRANEASADAGSTVGYVLTYANTGDKPAATVALTETVPANTVFAGPAGIWDCAVGDPAGTRCTQALGALDGKSSATTAFAVTVIDHIPAGVEAITNTAFLGSATQPDATSASVTTPLAVAPDLHLSKSDGGASAHAGDTIIYTLDYENRGSQAAANVILSEQTPTNSTFNNAASTPGWNCTGPTCTFALGNVTAGSSGSVDFAVTLQATLPANVTAITNTASIGDDGVNGADLNPEDNQAQDSTPIATGAELRASKFYTLRDDLNSDGVVNPGDVILYTIEIENPGSSAVTGVLFTDTFDVHTQLAADNAVQTDAGVVVNGKLHTERTVQVFVGALSAGQKVTIQFPVRIDKPLPAGVNFVENQGAVASNGQPSIATDDPSVAGTNNRTRTPVVTTAALQVSKTDLIAFDANNNGLVEPGDRLLYRIRVENSGDVELGDVTLADAPDPNTTLVVGSVKANRGAILRGNQANDSTVSVQFDNLLTGAAERGEVSFEVTINGDIAVEQVANQAVARYQLGGGLFTVFSDDPDTSDRTNDATVTPVTLAQSVTPVAKIFLPLIHLQP